MLIMHLIILFRHMKIVVAMVMEIVIKLVSCSTQLNMKFILLINVKMPTVVGNLICISRIYIT